MDTKRKNQLLTAGAALLWLAVWQLASMAVGQQLYLPSPLAVVAELAALVPTGVFWLTILNSLSRIALGFALGLLLGLGLGWASMASRVVEVLLRPLMQLVRATPVASFIILALMWFTGRNLSIFISLLMVLPVLYASTRLGIASADDQLLEMCRVFRVPFWRRLRAVYLPALTPGLLSSCELALGMSWKSGVAAEVIGIAPGSIGERLYQAKIFFMAPRMFAWTAVIIVVSWLFAKGTLALLRAGATALQKGVAP